MVGKYKKKNRSHRIDIRESKEEKERNENTRMAKKTKNQIEKARSQIKSFQMLLRKVDDSPLVVPILKKMIKNKEKYVSKLENNLKRYETKVKVINFFRDRAYNVCNYKTFDYDTGKVILDHSRIFPFKFRDLYKDFNMDEVFLKKLFEYQKNNDILNHYLNQYPRIIWIQSKSISPIGSQSWICCRFER